MTTRRDFIKTTGALAIGSLLLPYSSHAAKVKNVGIQLFTLRKDMVANPLATLEALAKMGYKELESARSNKGNYYGFTPAEIKKITNDLGMRLVSGHVGLGDNWQKTVDEAAEAGQTYLVCPSLPGRGQTVSNYQKVAEQFNKAGETCKKSGIVFGYHNHAFEFEQKDGKVLYDVLLEETDPNLVKMELDLGWAVVAGVNPSHYFQKHPNRFHLWHVRDIKTDKPESTEFGNGKVNFVDLFQQAKASGMKHFFVEQDRYANTPLASVEHNIGFLKKLKY